MINTISVHELDAECNALQRHYDAIHRRAEGSAEYAGDLTYRLNELKTTIADAVHGCAEFSNETKRKAEIARRLSAEWQELIDDEATASRRAKQDRAELDRSEQQLKTARARFLVTAEREIAAINNETAQLRQETARMELEAAQAHSAIMPRIRTR